MSVGPTVSILASAAGTPMAQVKGSEIDTTRRQTEAFKIQLHQESKAESAAGVAASDGEGKSVTERDADGRQAWEVPARSKTTRPTDEKRRPMAYDPANDSGTELDLCG